jgi:hypothetical protein
VQGLVRGACSYASQHYSWRASNIRAEQVVVFEPWAALAFQYLFLLSGSASRQLGKRFVRT